jgi:ferredoxin
MKFEGNTKVGDTISLAQLREKHDAVYLACGKIEQADAEAFGLKANSKGPVVDSGTYQTSLPGVFAGGGVIRNRKLAIRAIADGKEAAISIERYLAGDEVTGPVKPFNSRIGGIDEDETEQFLAEASRGDRVTPSAADSGYADEEARSEAERCLHCDCRKPNDCKLRDYSQQYNAKATEFKADRKSFVQYRSHPDIIYEPGKCIDCGLCIQIAAKMGEKLGLTFVGRGFNVRVAVPFDKSVSEGLKLAALECAKACPTGALAVKE